MNQLIILLGLLVLFTYYGGKHVPKLLKDNKKNMVVIVSVLLFAILFKRRETVEGLCFSDNPESDREALENIRGMCRSARDPNGDIIMDNLTDDCMCAFKYYVSQCNNGSAVDTAWWNSRDPENAAKLLELRNTIGEGSPATMATIEEIYEYIENERPTCRRKPVGRPDAPDGSVPDTESNMDLPICEDDPNWYAYQRSSQSDALGYGFPERGCDSHSTSDCTADSFLSGPPGQTQQRGEPGFWGMRDHCELKCSRHLVDALGDPSCRLPDNDEVPVPRDWPLVNECEIDRTYVSTDSDRPGGSTSANRCVCPEGTRVRGASGTGFLASMSWSCRR